MTFVNIKSVGDSVVIVKSSKDDYSLYTSQVNKLRLSKKLEVVRSATSVYDDLMYSVLVPNNLSKSEQLDLIRSAIEKVDTEERNDVQQLNMKILLNSEFTLIHY